MPDVQEIKAARVSPLSLSNVSAGNRAVTNICGSGFPGAGETVLAVDALNTVGRVDVFDKSNLPAGSPTLAGGDGGVGKEVFPDLQLE
jgi:hypothetical protein